jgi:uncharacterized protein (DUF305 family)
MKTSVIAALAAASIAAAGASWAQHGGHAGHGNRPLDAAALQAMVRDMLPKAKDAPSTRGLKEAHLKMMRDMHISYSGRADVDFVRGMIAHHQGAIDMAKVELEFGKDPELRKLAEDIIRAQEAEIAQMQAWLAANAK